VNVRHRLREINQEIARLQTEIQILEEQVAFQQEVAEDARIRSLVSETPLADRDAAEAAGDLARLQRSRDDAKAQLDALRAETDRLLERMLDDR
jgi:TolA-binding protein